LTLELSLSMLAKAAGAAAVVAAAYAVGRLVEAHVRKLKVPAPPELLANLGRASKYLILIAGLLAALPLLGVNLAGALAAAGFAGIVVGLAAQQTLGQLFSGLALLLEGRAKVGDSVRIGDDWGVVEEVGILSTKVRLWSGEVVTLPNSLVMESRIYNYSRSAARRGEVVIGVSFASDVGRAIEVIQRALWESELVLAEPSPVVIVDSLGESSVNLKVLFWAPTQEFWTVRRTVLAELKKALEAAGIEIPFPQRVVWLKREQGG